VAGAGDAPRGADLDAAQGAHDMAVRDYDALVAGLTTDGSRDDRMRTVADRVWDALHDRGVSWVGFYLDQPAEPDDRRLVLGPCRDQPACSPLGLHGVCGAAFRTRAVQIVRDVADLGPNYIACDPRDRSELVIPLLDDTRTCWGVLDLDSHEVNAFGPEDVIGLRRVLQAAGLT
jgi:putative methionine-R-sulfoxide reductase with GAF domain